MSALFPLHNLIPSPSPSHLALPFPLFFPTPTAIPLSHPYRSNSSLYPLPYFGNPSVILYPLPPLHFNPHRRPHPVLFHSLPLLVSRLVHSLLCTSAFTTVVIPWPSN